MIKKLKSEIVKSIKNKRINVFFLFLFSAFIILIFTKLSKEYTNTLAFEIEKINVPQENIILNDSVKLNITLKTHGFKWLKYYISQPKIKVDFSKDVYKKQGVFMWSKSKAYLNNTQFNKQVELLNISPDTLIFRYGINLVKKVPVKVNADVNFTPGYNMSSKLVSEPDSIVIVGPNILVSKIHFLETEEITINDVRSNISKNTKLKLPENKSDLNFSNNEVTIKAKVEKFTEGTLNIPITIINKPKDITIKYFPKAVNVSYYVSLSDYSSITNKNFKVVCDYNKISDNQSFLIPEFAKTPEKVRNAKISQQRIEFIITK
ncbi:YbbR-like protein [Flaviramulus basaltis]|uniref:YbbR-like protein n=1 Tax=Flaviramulus basaltis TaxID=369401 RepID=A0A1K2IIP2_9FLAO|nr:YbbR-like domain-containing protein [Flaviramulus basaltis]SFZ92146.1 YbbR-like protein [Flaviramulus basaltis]